MIIGFNQLHAFFGLVPVDSTYEFYSLSSSMFADFFSNILHANIEGLSFGIAAAILLSVFEYARYLGHVWVRYVPALFAVTVLATLVATLSHANFAVLNTTQSDSIKFFTPSVPQFSSKRCLKAALPGEDFKFLFSSFCVDSKLIRSLIFKDNPLLTNNFFF